MRPSKLTVNEAVHIFKGIFALKEARALDAVELKLGLLEKRVAVGLVLGEIIDLGDFEDTH